MSVVVRRAVWLALFAAACASPACVSWWHHPDPTVRVLVFNIHAGKDAAGKDNLQDVAALARTSGATVVLLQEVDRGTARSGKIDQVAVLGEHAAIGEHAAVGDRPGELRVLLDLSPDEAHHLAGGALVVCEPLRPESDERGQAELPPER